MDIPYPRSHDVVTSRRFRELAAETTAVVHEEAIKAFVLGETEG